MRRLLSLVIFLLLLAAIGHWVMFGELNLADSQVRIQEAPQVTQSGSEGCRVFVIGEATNEDPTGGDEMFGDSDSVGVWDTTVSAFPDRMQDFVAIGSDNAAREQFLLQRGYSFRIPDRKWQTSIFEVGMVGNELRVLAGVGAGKDVLGLVMAGGTSMDEEVSLSEIWRLNPIGIPPTLLERLRIEWRDGYDWRHDGLETTIEKPLEPIDPFWLTGPN